VSTIEDLVRWNASHPGGTAHAELEHEPRRHLIVLTCTVIEG
jgi:hypothetical protein